LKYVITNVSNLDYSAVLVLIPAVGYENSLVEKIKSIFDGTLGTRMSNDVSKAAQAGFFTYDVSLSSGKIYVTFSFGEQIKAMVEGYL